MHFPPVKYLCPAVSGKSMKCAPGHSDERAHFRRKKAAGLPQGITGGACFHPRTTKRTPAALLSSAVQFSCLAPWSRWLLVCILPSQEVSPNGGLSSRRPRPLRCILAPTVPFAWGSFAPFLSGWHLAVFRPLRYPPHSILGHDSIIRLCVLAESFLSYSIRQEKSTVRPMQNGCVVGLQYLLHHGPGAPLLFAEPAAAAADRRRGYGAAGKIKPAGMPPAQGLPRRRHFFAG